MNKHGESIVWAFCSYIAMAHSIEGKALDRVLYSLFTLKNWIYSLWWTNPDEEKHENNFMIMILAQISGRYIFRYFSANHHNGLFLYLSCTMPQRQMSDSKSIEIDL